jgi:uncharacterized protein
MRLSAFNQYVADYPEPGQTLVYNTFSGGFASLDASTFAILMKADAGGMLDDSERQLIEPELSDLFDDSVGILVDSRAAEERAFRDWFKRRMADATKLSALVSITFACNFDCPYCCQADVLNGRMMGADTGAATAKWLADRALEIGAREIIISFIGGEPLLNPDRVEQIVRDVRARVADRGIVVTFNLITNGYYLSPELVDAWVPLGLTGAQVTLDGDETTHKLTRVSKKGEDTFARIFANAVSAAKRIRVHVNGNYQENTIHGFVPLLTKLREAGLGRGSSVFFSPAIAALGAPAESGSGACHWSGSHPEVMIALGDEIRRNGFDPGDIGSIGPCGFHQRSYFAIDPLGHIYKCPGFMGKSEWAVGHVTSGLTARFEGLANINPQRLCGDCAHRPECAGGCVAAIWMASGRTEGVNCEIGFYDRHGEELVKRRFAVATSESPEAAAASFTSSVTLPERPPARGRSSALRVIAA